MKDRITVLLVDDHHLVRNGIKSSLESDPEIVVIGEGSNGLEAIDQVRMLQPDVLIIDIAMPEMNGLEAATKISADYPGVNILMLSMHDDQDYVLGSLEAGASGYLLKDTSKEEFIRAIKTVNEGNKYFSSDVSEIIAKGYLQRVNNPKKIDSDTELTKKEVAVLREIVKGRNNREIAEEFNKSVRTIEAHRFNIMKKLQVKNAVELVRVAIEDKLV